MTAFAASVTVITVLRPVDPGITVGGLNVAVAPGGKPVTDIVTTALYAPPIGGTVIVMLTEPPWVSEYGVGAPR